MFSSLDNAIKSYHHKIVELITETPEAHQIEYETEVLFERNFSGIGDQLCGGSDSFDGPMNDNRVCPSPLLVPLYHTATKLLDCHRPPPHPSAILCSSPLSLLTDDRPILRWFLHTQTR